MDVGGRFQRLKTGDFSGEMAPLAPDKRMAAVRAVQPVRALKVPSEAFQSFLLEHPNVAVSMLKTLVLRLREVEQRMDAWMAPWACDPLGIQPAAYSTPRTQRTRCVGRGRIAHSARSGWKPGACH